jgi:hypothetical protein
MLLFPLSLLIDKYFHLLFDVKATLSTRARVHLRMVLVRVASFVHVLLTSASLATFLLASTTSRALGRSKMIKVLIRHVFTEQRPALIVLLLLVFFENLSRVCSCQVESFQGSHDEAVSRDWSHDHQNYEVEQMNEATADTDLSVEVAGSRLLGVTETDVND